MASKNIGKEINGFFVLDSFCKKTEKGYMTFYNVKCSKCGNITEKYCGNVNKGVAACEKCSEKYERHGHSKTKLYHVYNSMLARCYYSKNTRYKNYGGRGVTVCEEWKNSFTAFYEWAIANGYKDGLSIDRIDVNGNYEPSNCRWANACEQMNNTTRNHYLEWNGKTQSMALWAKETGIPYAILNQRISKLHWSAERALTTPARKLKRKGVGA
jgi:hypothetical protein